MLALMLLPCVGCFKEMKWQSPFRSPLVKAEAPATTFKDKILNQAAIGQVFERSGWLMTILILGGVAGIILTLACRMRFGIFITIGCWAGALMLVTLAGWAYVIGLLMLVAGLALLVIMLIRWKKVADCAIEYADGLKKHISPMEKEKVNVEADRVQSKKIKKYILRERKSVKPLVNNYS
jgi:hypothetical protein